MGAVGHTPNCGVKPTLSSLDKLVCNQKFRFGVERHELDCMKSCHQISEEIKAMAVKSLFAKRGTNDIYYLEQRKPGRIESIHSAMRNTVSMAFGIE